MGVLLRDYHTTETPRGTGYATRRLEILAVKNQKKSGSKFEGTILSKRDYRCDASYTVAIIVAESSPYTVQQLAAALLKPVFMLYLGRKSCPLAMPLQPQIVNAATLREALASVSLVVELSGIVQKGDAMVFWEDDTASGLERQQVITRRDEPRSRRRWQFSERRESCGMLRKGEEPCTSA
jgi:CRISPR system Cascade subunit CasD